MNWSAALSLSLCGLMLMSGLAAAEPGTEPSSGASGSSSSSPPPPSSAPPSNASEPKDGPGSDPQARSCFEQAKNDTARRACAQAFCDGHPDASWCKQYCPNGTCPTPPSTAPKPPAGNTSGQTPPKKESGTKPTACDIKGNPVYCRERFCSEHPEASFCRQGDAKETIKEAVKEAAQKRKMGAEVALANNAKGGVKVLPYDNVTIDVAGADHVATQGSPITVRLSSNLTSGRTFVFTIDPGLLPRGDDAESIVVRYYDVSTAGQNEVVLVKASSLQDVMDASDDGGQPEYWIVHDENGIQLFTSVPHWSTHVLSISGLDAVLQPTVLVGLVAGLAGTVIAAVALFVPRRRDD